MHVTRDSNTTLKVKDQRQLAGGGGMLWRPPAQLVQPQIASAFEGRFG